MTDPTLTGYFPEQFTGADLSEKYLAAMQAAFDARVPFNMNCGTDYVLSQMADFGDDSRPGHVAVNGHMAKVTADHDDYAVMNFTGIENRAALPIERFKIAQASGRKNYAGMLFARPDTAPARSSGMAQVRHVDALGDFEHGIAELVEAEGLTFASDTFFQTGEKGPVIAFRDNPVPGVTYPPMLTSGSTKTRLIIEGSNLLACLNELNNDPIILLDNIQDARILSGVELHHANFNCSHGLIHMQGHTQGVVIDNPFCHIDREHIVTFGTPGGTAVEAYRFDIKMAGRAGMGSSWHVRHIGDGDARIHGSSIDTYGNIDLRGAMFLDGGTINMRSRGATILADRTMYGTIRYPEGTNIPWKGTAIDRMTHEVVRVT